MKFGIFYEHQLPRPWDEESEYRLLQDSLDEMEVPFLRLQRHFPVSEPLQPTR